MDYTRLSFADVTDALADTARDARATFGALTVRQLNWRPDAARWSVAQCFQHLLTADRLMIHAAGEAVRNPPTSVWQRLPLLPRLNGRLLIRSQSPGAPRKYTAPTKSRPSTSELPGDLIERFAAQHHEAAGWWQALDERIAARAIMISPFIPIVTYSVMDGLRLVVAHDRRHFEQARRITRETGFPAA
jgi:hypothetical protein